jgi:ferrous iron transport protein B
VAAVASVRSEMGGKWALYVVVWQCFVAWLAAVVIRVIGLMLGLG